MDPAIKPLGLLVHRRPQFLQKMECRMVENPVNRIEAQGIDAEFRYPKERIVNKEPPDFVAVRPVKIDGCTPRSVVSVGKVGPKILEIISFRPEMVVDHIQDNRQARLVTGIDQALERRRSPVRVLHREREDAVVGPTPVEVQLDQDLLLGLQAQAILPAVSLGQTPNPANEPDEPSVS